MPNLPLDGATRTGSTSTRRRAWHCATILLSLAASCTAWRPVPGASLAPAQAERVDQAMVFLRDGTVLELRDAVISPDSIVGHGGSTSTRMAVPRGDVLNVDTKSAEPLTTLLGGALAGFAAVLVTLRVLLF